MKPIREVVMVVVLSGSSIVFADQACREDAENTGYLGAVELLPPCDASVPAHRPTNEPETVEARPESIPDSKTVAQAEGPPAR